jgi:predicted nucleic acid-binding protein
MMFLDTNVILRYLTADIPDKAERCMALLERADRGEIILVTSEVMIAEVVYALSSPRIYRLERDRIRDLLMPIVTLRGLRLPSRQVVIDALELYATQRVDFEDALAVAHMRAESIHEIVSYDTHFDSIPGINRVEP